MKKLMSTLFSDMRSSRVISALLAAIALLAGCHPDRSCPAAPAASAAPVKSASTAALRDSVGHAPQSDEPDYACRILKEIDTDPNGALTRIITEPKRLTRLSNSECFDPILDSLTDRFIRGASDRNLDALAAIWGAADDDIADGITDSYGVDLLDNAFEPTLEYLYRHHDENDLESAIVESAAVIIEDADDPMQEMRAFRRDIRRIARDLPKDERSYLSGLWHRIVVTTLDGDLPTSPDFAGI
jgi:hypothetical protein